MELQELNPRHTWTCSFCYSHLLTTEIHQQEHNHDLPKVYDQLRDSIAYFITHRDPFLADLDFSLSCSWPEPDLLAVAAEVAVAEEVAFLRLAAVGVDSSSSPMTATVREKCSLSDR